MKNIQMKSKIYRILRRLEKYTKTDMVYLAKGGFWLTLGQGISSVSAFLLAIAFANLLPKETYGTYKYVLSIFGLLAIPTLSGMGVAITRAVAQGKDGSFLPALRLKIRWGLLGALASLGLAGYYFVQNNTELTFVFLITAIFVPFMDSFALYGTIFQGKKKFDISSRYGIWIKITASLSIFATLYFTRNLLAILFAYFASYTFLRLIVLKLSLKFVENKKEDPGAISYGKHLSLMGIIGMVAAQIDKILLFHFLGAGNLAIYLFALAPLDILKGPLGNITKLILPKFAERKSSEIKNNIKNKFKILFIVNLGIMISYILIIPFLFKMFFPQYMGSVFFSQIFAVSLLASSLNPAGVFLQAKKKIKEQYISRTINPIMQVVLTFILIIWLGIWGAILVKMFSRFSGAFLDYYFYKKSIECD
jgi:O-antigen/teichoic acid export membrane protein